MTITQAFKKLASKMLGKPIDQVEGNTISEVIDYTAENYDGSSSGDKSKALSFAEQYALGDFPDGYVIIPDGAKTIGPRAFYAGGVNSGNYVGLKWKDAITNVYIPDGVVNIGLGAFGEINTLISIYIPGSVTHIGDTAFVDCRNLANIYYAGTEQQWNAITKGDGWNNGMGNNVTGGTTIHYNYVPDTN